MMIDYLRVYYAAHIISMRSNDDFAFGTESFFAGHTKSAAQVKLNEI
jgi:hypothetical protein